MSADRMSLETLSRCEAVGLLASATIGRVVFTVAALPAVVPVTFAVRDDAIVLRTSAETRLAVAADGGVLAFEVDEVDPQKRTGWSVVVTGIAEVVTDPVKLPSSARLSIRSCPVSTRYTSGCPSRW